MRDLGVELRAKDGKLLLNAPAGVLTEPLQQELRRRKPELLALLFEDDEEQAPLTYAQQRLWLIDQISPDSVAYNIPQAWIVEGAIDREALTRAISSLAERHRALRTRIEVRNGQPFQVVASRVDVPLEFTDLSAEADPEIRDAKLSSLLLEDGRRPFVLGGAPLIRFHLFRLAEHRHLFSYNIHHIIADQWSLNVLKHDLTALYAEALSGHPAGLPSISLEYSSLAERERSDIVNALYRRQLEYWRERLRGMPALLELPFCRSRSSEQTDAGATISVTLDEGLTAQLRQLAARSHTSLYPLMLSVFATLLYRYTGQTDICLGSPISGRRRREEEILVGLFINMLPVRCTVEPAESFSMLLKRTGTAVLSDFEHSDIPFQKLVMELHPERSLTHSPLFQISFSLNPGDGNADGDQREIFLGTSKYDLTLQISEQSKTLNAHFEYRADLFARDDIKRFIRHFIRLAESVVKAPETEIAALSLLTADDLEVLNGWNATALSFDRNDILPSLFKRQAAAHPDALALCCGDERLSYRELSERVSRLAASLTACGAGPEKFVAICLDRSPALIVSMLAVLETGAAYLPLDPKYPAERLKYMLQDSGARIMVAEENGPGQELARNCPELTIVPPSAESLTPDPIDATAYLTSTAARPDGAAYLIYTSGSTGTPKGVVVEHRNAVALLAWAKSHFDEDSLRAVLASTSVCFDLSIFEIFLPLATGNTVVLVNDILELPRSSHAANVTLINTVPSAMSALLHAGLPSKAKTVCMAGEFLPSDLVDRVCAAGVKRVFDLYGPTETTTYSTCALRMPGTPPTIGNPIANTRIYLVDENLTRVPLGAAGEIFIGGDGVTRGYLHRPELTAERFVTLPAIEPQGRLYRTGDWARQAADGSLIFLGRRDQQVKLRGHRIELGEIESVLRDLTGSSDTAVVIQKREAGDLLVAFVVDTQAHPIDPKHCAEALRERLPAYMVPALIVPVPALPRTPNGKVDRKTLSLMTETGAGHASEPPRDLLEQWLANIWALRLGTNEIPRDAHFFDDLGGHSLAAFEVFTEIESRLGVAMGLATLFEAPTVALLAAVIRKLDWNAPQYIRFLAPGTSQKVIYLIGRPPSGLPKFLSSSCARVMVVGDKGTADASGDLVRDIAMFEAARPALVLRTDGAARKDIRDIVSGLSRAGFADISTSQVP